MCHSAVLGAVDKLEEHRVGDVQPRKLVQSAGWKEYFASMVCLDTIRTGEHGNGIAPKVLVEAPRGTTAA
jgi:hypothetical protein